MNYLAGARYKFNDHATLYVRYATGYRPGGPNSVVINPATGLPATVPTFGTDTLKSYEVGLKLESPTRQYGGELSASYIQWDNIQTFDLSSPFGGLTNAPDGATIKAIQASFFARPNDDFSITSNISYLDTMLSGATPALGSVRGDRLANVPRVSGSVTAEYVISQAVAKPRLGLSFNYVSERQAGYTNSAVSNQHTLPSYTLVNVYSGVKIGVVDLQVYVHNLFDSRAQLSGLTLGGPPQIAIAQPRTIGVSLSSHF